MAKIKPPPKTTNKTPGNRKKPDTPSKGPTDKSPPQEVKTLTFKVPKTFHKEFKGYATNNDISMTDLLYNMYEEYRKIHG